MPEDINSLRRKQADLEKKQSQNDTQYEQLNNMMGGLDESDPVQKELKEKLEEAIQKINQLSLELHKELSLTQAEIDKLKGEGWEGLEKMKTAGKAAFKSIHAGLSKIDWRAVGGVSIRVTGRAFQYTGKGLKLANTAASEIVMVGANAFEPKLGKQIKEARDFVNSTFDLIDRGGDFVAEGGRKLQGLESTKKIKQRKERIKKNKERRDKLGINVEDLSQDVFKQISGDVEDIILNAGGYDTRLEEDMENAIQEYLEGENDFVLQKIENSGVVSLSSKQQEKLKGVATGAYLTAMFNSNISKFNSTVSDMKSMFNSAGNKIIDDLVAKISSKKQLNDKELNTWQQFTYQYYNAT